VQYLTVNEAVRRLRAAGVNAHSGTVREWIKEQRVRDIWVLGRHTFIYEAELDALIAGNGR
jgi:excisionase family DNA binding protein